MAASSSWSRKTIATRPSVAPGASKKLIEEHQVFALLGYVGTPTGVAHLPVVTQAKVPLVGMFTGAEVLRVPFNRYVFHVRASYYDETEKIVEQVTLDRRQEDLGVLPERRLRRGRPQGHRARAERSAA